MIHTDTSTPWATMLWQATSGTMANFDNMLTPSQYDFDYEDLDSNSYRSVISGNLYRSIVGKKWAKISMKFNILDASQLAGIVDVINGNNLKIRAKAPVFGTASLNPITGDTAEWFEMDCYVSKFSAKLLEGQIGYELSFNLIQSKRGNWM